VAEQAILFLAKRAAAEVQNNTLIYPSVPIYSAKWGWDNLAILSEDENKFNMKPSFIFMVAIYKEVDIIGG
jgi:hypothetical protein